MYITEVTYNKLNELIKGTFQMNSFLDNIAYNLSDMKLVKCEEVFHTKYAHLFPGLADQISEMMAKLDCRAIRGPLDSNTKKYDNIIDLFNDVQLETLSYRELIKQTIEIADFNDDYEVKIMLEEFLLNFMINIRQADIWKQRAVEYVNTYEFDRDFEKFTII